MSPMDTYPLSYDVTPPEGARNRLTTAFRFILAIPHILLVGGPGVGWGMNSSTGVFGGVAAIVSVIAWFAIRSRVPSWDITASASALALGAQRFRHSSVRRAHSR